MTVNELIEELKKYPGNLEVVKVPDSNLPDNGMFEVESISCVDTQTYYDDQFGSDNDETVVYLL